MGTDDGEPVDTRSGHGSNWERWTADDGPFYRACAVFPLDSLSDGRAGGEKPAVEFTSGVTRLLLRNLPTVLLAVLAVYLPTKAYEFVSTGRLAVDIPLPDLRTVGLLVPGVVIGVLWLYLVYRIGSASLRGSSLHRSVVFFATAVPLAAGTVHAVYSAWLNVGSGGRPAVTVQAGYFLFVLVAGHLVYDGLALRAENLFERLGDTDVVDRPAYEAFYDDLAGTLGDTLRLGGVQLPRSLAFAVTVALVPILLPLVVMPWRPVEAVSYVAYSLVTLFVVAMLYDVFVLVYEFTDLLRRDVLTYQPFHPDEHGGFRDLGRFATRINAILAVAGGYVAYRFYAEGLLVLPESGSPLLALTWVVLYLAPIAAYVFLVLFWLYHSFWQLHRTMEEGRRRRMEELQAAERDDRGDARGQFADLETDAPAWESLQAAPTWPIKRQSLLGILLIDATPVALTFLL